MFALNKPNDWPEEAAVWRQDRLLLPNCFIAASWWRRSRGLIGRPGDLAAGGLLLLPCNCVHNMFMSYAIDLVFINNQGQVVKVRENFRPWCPYAGSFKATATLELLAGRAKELQIQVGDILQFQAR